MAINHLNDKDIVAIGSNNILGWFRLGVVARDMDEVILQKTSPYLRKKGREIRLRCNEIESVNLAIVIGGTWGRSCCRW